MVEAMIAGLIQVFMWPAIGFLGLGMLLGIALGAVPGLGGVLGLVLLLPFTYAMDPVPALALLLGMYTVTSTSDTIASVMLGIPGSAASQATILDGYPMAKQGEAARALGAAFYVSAIGGVIGAAIMAVSLPILFPVIRAFGVPEFLLLAILGVTLVGALSGRAQFKGLAVAAVGLLITAVGFSQATGIPRYAFQTPYLMDGIPIILLVMGLFAIPELLDLTVRNTSIARVSRSEVSGRGILQGIRDVHREWWLALRSSVLGTYVGMLPALGPSIADWIAYGHAVQSSKDKSRFGKGDVRGVIAPEAANNATKAGALIPMVAFGIPGSLGTAILLGALIIQGLRPGVEMMTTKLDLTYAMIWTIVIANIVVSGLLLWGSRYIARLAFVPGHLLVPGVLCFILMGAWIASASLGDWIVCIGAGIVGYWMKKGGWPRPPLILALVLGALIEANLDLTVQIYPGLTWITDRPIAMAIFALIVLVFLSAIWSALREARSRAQAEAPLSASGAPEAAGDAVSAQRRNASTEWDNPIFSLLFAAALLPVLIAAIWMAQDWSVRARQFPVFAAGFALCMLVPVVLRDLLRLASLMRGEGGSWAALRSTVMEAELGRSLLFLAGVTAILPATMLIGQKLSLALFTLLFLGLFTRYTWITAALYALAVGAFIHFFYDVLMGLHFYPSVYFRGW